MGRHTKKDLWEIYSPESKVFAVNRMSVGGKVSNYLTIYEAVVDSVEVRSDSDGGVSYWLRTPGGEVWGDSVCANDVSHIFQELIRVIKPIWLAESDSFGDE